jgi:hypothetical protein
MTQEQPWFFQERAEAFAKLLLTKRNEVQVLPAGGHERGIDLLVEALEEGKPTLRFFGVLLVPHLDLPDRKSLESGALSAPAEQAPVEASLPVCVFVIGVRKPEGLYRWSVEPVVEAGRALLRRGAEAHWQALDETGVARLVAQVNAWYDALNGRPTPKKGRHAKTEG